jgi:hypothetical protein
LQYIFFLFIALIVVLVIFGAVHAERRRKELRAWARSRRMSFRARPDYSIDNRYPEFDCFRRGDNRYAHNIMHGTREGRGAWAMDYHYETTSRDSDGDESTTHHHFSAILLEVDLPLRPLFIRPEGFFDKIGEFFGLDDIDFESAEFSRKFFVKSKDKRWAFDVIQQTTMEFLLASPRYTIQFGDRVIAAWNVSTFDPADFEAAFQVVEGILDRLPESLLREMRDRKGADA